MESLSHSQLTQKQRQFLRKQAHDLKPLVQIGKNGVSEQTVYTVDQALAAHELIKVKFNDFQDQKHELSEDLAQRTESALVAVIGNIAVLYRENPDPQERKLLLPL